MKSNYYIKYENIIPKHFFEKKNINILEFGVEKGQTTSLFLSICEKNEGSVISVDTLNFKNLFEDKNWTFINSRDDNFKEVEKRIKNTTFDIICLDTIHTKNHIKKILEHYFKYLKVDGIFIIDGTSNIPYLKKNYRDNFYSEINNSEIYNYLLNLKNNIDNKILLDISYEGSGVARITKLDNFDLLEKKRISRVNSIKNFLRKLHLYFR